MKNNLWDYSAALSFGRTEIYDDFLEKSYVGRLHKDFGYEPVATFDLGNIGQNDSSAIYIGSYEMSGNSEIVGTTQNYAYDKGWSFGVFYYGDYEEFFSGYAYLDSEFPYVSMDQYYYESY